MIFMILVVISVQGHQCKVERTQTQISVPNFMAIRPTNIVISRATCLAKKKKKDDNKVGYFHCEAEEHVFCFSLWLNVSSQFYRQHPASPCMCLLASVTTTSGDVTAHWHTLVYIAAATWGDHRRSPKTRFLAGAKLLFQSQIWILLLPLPPKKALMKRIDKNTYTHTQGG